MTDRFVIRSEQGPIMKFENLADAKKFLEQHRTHNTRALLIHDTETGERITP